MEVLRGEAGVWVAAEPNQRLGIGDKLRTGENSRATIQLANASVERLRSLTVITIEAPRKVEGGISLLLERGALFFKSWAKPETQEFRTPTVAGAIRGTEFYLTVADDGSTVVSLIDGEVHLTSPDGSLPLKSGEQATIERGRAPAKTAVLETTRIVQWYLYYPGVLDIGELGFSELQQRELFGSWSAYAAGDLPNALRLYPAGRAPGNPSEAVYRAGLLLSVGEVAQAEAQLATVETAAAAANSRPARLAAALREVIAAVQFRAVSINTQPELASEWVTRSYLLQSRFDLAGALHAAHQAVRVSPSFGFAHARVAELEFSHGRTRETAAALAKTLEFSPVNAQALALEGFVRAAQNRHREALASFERAIEADAALGNGWLGRGLIKIRRGQTQQGLADLQIAATLEPNRSLLRSYLGKGYSQIGDHRHADRELALAKLLDSKDPTPWLYKALADEQENKINSAVRGIEKSQLLNDNRRTFRSQLLLDQDKSIRSANLARIYDNAGLGDVGTREASRSVLADYDNYAAHLFLSNSYDRMRRLNPLELRFETPAFSEFLIASLLSPVDGRLLAQPVSQQEYTKLFDQAGFHAISSTDYRSDGTWSQYGAQYGTTDKFGYAIEGEYRWVRGSSVNHNSESRTISAKTKHYLTEDDMLLLSIASTGLRYGDIAQKYDPNQFIEGVRSEEKQEPTITIGANHRWNEHNRTLVLASHTVDGFQFWSPNARVYLLQSDSSKTPIIQTDLSQSYTRRLTIDGIEIQHLLRLEGLQTIAGVRLQRIAVQASNQHVLGPFNALGTNRFYFDPFNPSTAFGQLVDTSSLRLSPYVYQSLQVARDLTFIGGHNHPDISPTASTGYERR